MALFTNEVIKKNRRLSKNSLNLEEQGIEDVSSDGVPSNKAMSRLFRDSEMIKICALGASGFLLLHWERIEAALAAGTEIRLLIAQENSEYIADISRQMQELSYKKLPCEKMDRQRALEESLVRISNGIGCEYPDIMKRIKDFCATDFVGEYDDNQSKEIVLTKMLIELLQKRYSKRIEYRQFNTEYRNKFILGYAKEDGIDKDIIYGYYNAVVPVRSPKEALLFYGRVNENQRSEYIKESREDSFSKLYKGRIQKDRNFIFDLELHFDYLWDKYALEKRSAFSVKTQSGTSSDSIADKRRKRAS